MNHSRRFFSRHSLNAFLCALLLGGCGGSRDKTLTGAANSFFESMHKGHYAEAYDSAAFGFQVQQNAKSFEAIARDMALGDYNSCKWTVLSSTTKEAHLNGEFTDRNNQPYTIEAILIPEKGLWRIFSLRYHVKDSKRFVDLFVRSNPEASFNEAFARNVPGDKEAAALVSHTLKKLNEGIHKKDFTAFYNDTSMLWQSQTSMAKVERAFTKFIESGLNLDGIVETKPVFDEKRLNSEGALLLKGYYPTQPNRVLFDLKYTYELPMWKLLGITVSIKP
jgi:hypothetical protein